MSTVTMDVTEYDELRKCKAEMPFDVGELALLREIADNLNKGKEVSCTLYDSRYGYMDGHRTYTFYNIPEFFDKLEKVIMDKFTYEYDKKLNDKIRELKCMSLKEFKVWKDL